MHCSIHGFNTDKDRLKVKGKRGDPARKVRLGIKRKVKSKTLNLEPYQNFSFFTFHLLHPRNP